MKRDVTELKRLFFEVMQNPAAAAQNPGFLNEVKELQTQEIPTPILVTSSQSATHPVLIHDA